MTDRYASFAASAPGAALIRRLGLPNPPRLRRHRPGDPVLPGPVLVGGHGPASAGLATALDSIGARWRTSDPAGPGDGEPRDAALVFDATGIDDTAGLRALYDFFHPHARTLRPNGRVVVVGLPPRCCDQVAKAVAARALSGFVRSVGKEFGRGVTANLVCQVPGADLTATLRFLLSARSAYVSGQVLTVEPGEPTGPVDWDRPLADRVAVVTGAARGIGAAIARVLARDGAHVVCLDVPAAGEALAAVAGEVAGSAYQLDITGPDAPRKLAGHLAVRHGGVDVVVHNAGITRDKTLARMTADQWDAVLDVNLAAQQRLDAALLDGGLVPAGGRLIGVASIAGIAGNRGQTNYATSKAGVIGLVEALAPVLRERGITVNAVAPGFIETAMTARMPLLPREAGRRLNSMSQGGLPVDVAEAVGFFAGAGSAGLTGNVLRVCGQSLLGA